MFHVEWLASDGAHCLSHVMPQEDAAAMAATLRENGAVEVVVVEYVPPDAD